MLGRAVAVLAAANVLNNRVIPRWAPVTSAVATGLLLAMARRSGLTSRDLGFTDAARGARTGGLLAAAVAAGYGAGVAWPRTRPLFLDERALGLTRARLLEEAFLQVPVGTVLLEEVGFRGVLYALLDRAHGPRTATAVSSALFGLWHILPAFDMAAANPALTALATAESPDEEPSRHDAVTEKPGDGVLEQVVVNERVRRGFDVGRLVAGTVVSTALAGVFFCELRRRRGLLAPALLHIATNSLGYGAAVTARALDARRNPAPPAQS